MASVGCSSGCLTARGSRLWLSLTKFRQAHSSSLSFINPRLSTKIYQIPTFNIAVTAGYCLCTRMMNILRRLSGFTGKDDGAHRRPTRKNTSWFNKRGEIIRERVPAYRLSEDELRDYLQKKFPRHKDFHIRVSILRGPLPPCRIANNFGWISFRMTISILKFPSNYPVYVTAESLQ